MNENNQNPLFPEDNSQNIPENIDSDIPLFSENPESFSPEAEEAGSPPTVFLSEEVFSAAELYAESDLPFQDTMEIELPAESDLPSEDIFASELYNTNEAPAEDGFLPEEEPAFAPSEEAALPEENVFNPYAPRSNDASGYNAGNNENPYSASTPPSQVNPTYNQPVNQPYNYNQNQYRQSYNQGYQQPTPKDNKNGKIIIAAIVAVCVIVGLIALVSSFFGGSDTPELNTTESTTSAFSSQVTENTTAAAQSAIIATTQASFDQGINSIWVAEKVRPSVVGVLAYKQGELAGEGSGVLMSEDISKNCTYVITCAHVIDEPGCEFAILLLDGGSYEAEVVALDERTDIGVLKVSVTGLPLAEFGDSASLKIGEPIYAIGNPGGSEYFGSITNGIIAAIDRSISATYTMTCIQHNAAINPGNSGGALVNTAGQVIGINSSKIAKTDYEGMGFAVPSAIFKPVVDALIQHGYVPNRPELGIKYASVSDYQLYSIIVSIKGLPKGSIIIAEIPEGSALSGTQAEVGDLIIAVNGKKMDSTDVLLDLIDTGAVGDTLTLTLCRVQSRTYETTTFDVTIQLVEDKGSITTTTQAATLPQQSNYSDFDSFFGDFFGW